MLKEKVTRHTNYKGKIYVYNHKGKLLKTYENKKQASIELEKETGIKFNPTAIGYASIGENTYVGCHKYKNFIFFNRVLNAIEISEYRRARIFN